jgi:hypothetical protein
MEGLAAFIFRAECFYSEDGGNRFFHNISTGI